jgi:tetratricopeptide (TPR) repeat protein
VKPARKPQPAGQVAASNDRVEAGKVDETLEKARRTLARGQYPQTLAILDTLSPVPEQRVDYWLLKGSAHLGLGQLDPAEQALESAQLMAPDNAQITVQRAILKQEKGDHPGALQILGDAATHHPDVPEIYLNQGYSRLELGDARDARRSFQVFLRLTEGRSLYEEQRKAVNEWLAQFPSS